MRCHLELLRLNCQIRRRADLRCHRPAYQAVCRWNLPAHCRRPVFPVEYHSDRMERSGLQTDRKKHQPVPGKRQMLLNYHPWMQQLLLFHFLHLVDVLVVDVVVVLLHAVMVSTRAAAQINDKFLFFIIKTLFKYNLLVF